MFTVDIHIMYAKGSVNDSICPYFGSINDIKKKYP